MLHVVTWKWKQKDYRVEYTADHVNRLARECARNLRESHRFICVTDDITGIASTVETHRLWDDHRELTNMGGAHLASCYRRLKLFDPATQALLGVKPGERIVSLDLDVLVTGRIDPLFARSEPFVGWVVKGIRHPRVFNGSVWLLRAGQLAHVWRDFEPNTSPQASTAAGYFGSDQGWLSYKLQGAAGWGAVDGVLSYPREARRELPSGARLVCFHGRRKPWEARTQDESPWVKRLMAAS